MSEINVTPLVDVMLVLLVVFIVTAPLLTQAVKVKLPKTVSTAAATPSPPHTVHILSTGEVSLDNRTLDDATLLQQLQTLAMGEVELRLHGDSQVSYGRVAEVMAMAQHAGITKLSFITVAK